MKWSLGRARFTITKSTENEKAVIVAETGASHEKSYARALALIHAAHQAGADAIKFSAFKPEQMTLNRAESPFVITDANSPWRGRTLYSLYEQSALPYDWIPDLKQAALSVGLEFILSIYHPETVKLAEQWGCRILKIASFELGWTELLKTIADSPMKQIVILSTGSATIEEIQAALDVLKEKYVILLHCISAYPAEPNHVNLRTMVDMKERFGKPVGLSDHSVGIEVSVCACCLGAVMIEKHLRLDNDSLDSSFAIFPDRFAAMVQACQEVPIILGQPMYGGKKTFHRQVIEGQYVRTVW